MTASIGFVLLAFALVACGADETGTPPTTSSATTDSTVETDPPSSEEPGSVTTGSIPTNELASGSGCTPGTAETLPDGRWYGLVAEASADRIDFDLACWFTGEAAITAAAEDGVESPPPNDYHTRNNSDRLRTLTVAADTNVWWLVNPGDPATAESIDFARWLGDRLDRSHQPAVWITVDGGTITGVEEQYVP